jgi:hypothetical protein
MAAHAHCPYHGLSEYLLRAYIRRGELRTVKGAPKFAQRSLNAGLLSFKRGGADDSSTHTADSNRIAEQDDACAKSHVVCIQNAANGSSCDCYDFGMATATPANTPSLSSSA